MASKPQTHHHDEPDHYIRLARADDARPILEIYKRFVTSSAVSFEYEVPSEIEMARRIQQSREKHAWIIYQLRGELVGYAYSSAFRGREAYQWTAEVSVYVHDDHGRKGIAANLYRVLHGLMRAQGYHTSVAVMTHPNPQSEAFHQAMGYEHNGTIQSAGYKSNAWHDVLFMTKSLQANNGAPAAITPVLELPSSILAQSFLLANLEK